MQTRDMTPAEARILNWFAESKYEKAPDSEIKELLYANRDFSMNIIASDVKNETSLSSMNLISIFIAPGSK